MKRKAYYIAIIALIISLLAMILTGCSGITEADLERAYEEGRDDGYASGWQNGFEAGYDEAYYDLSFEIELITETIGDPVDLLENYHDGYVSFEDMAYFIDDIKTKLLNLFY